MLELVIVRHGESIRNHASDLAHHGDTGLLEYQLRFERDEAEWDLTQRGIDQAKAAGIWIKDNIGEAFDARYVSPFKRTRQTAASLELPEGDWLIDPRLREREWGDYTAPGIPTYTVDQYLQDLSYCGAACWKGNFPGAESVEDMIPRCRSFVQDLFAANPARAILVTHGGTMKALQLILERLTVAEAGQLAVRQLTNCSVLQYRLEDTSNSPEARWTGQVRFASPALPNAPTSPWQPIAACANSV